MFGWFKTKPVNSSLFQVPALKVFGLAAGKRDRFGHTFGGASKHDGVLPKGGKQPLHLLYSLNMDDPKVGVRIPAVRWLPLYHGFVYDGCGLGYRVVSDSKIEILHLDSPLKIPKEFPYKDYPSAFPQFSVKICDTKFNAKDPKQALEYSGIFGFDWVP